VSVKYAIKPGECISSVAFAHGLFPDTIWNDPENREIREKRKSPNILHPGDIVAIPEKKIKEESAATAQTHRFQRKGVPEKFKMQFLDEKNNPLANQKYIIEIDGILSKGSTDGDGKIEQSIPPNARGGKIVIGELRDEYLLNFGHIDPIEEISGVQGRLNNLGYDCGLIDGVLGKQTKEALLAYQNDHGLNKSGDIDEETRRHLKEKHGS
jgi:hypothetical protein